MTRYEQTRDRYMRQRMYGYRKVINIELVYESNPYRVLAETIRQCFAELERTIPETMRPIFETFRVDISKGHAEWAFIITAEVDAEPLSRGQ